MNAYKEMKKIHGSDYKPRTRHLNPNGSPKYTNRLFLESSPYLLQHAHNPVDWYPWSDQAFETAQKLDRPILLSVGYSTCHWCHVMEEESFEDEKIASYLNENYIAIKVDREERPDVDSVYMHAVQAITGRGGWPMTIWLTPDRKPFYGGTYFPPRDGDRGATVGFLSLLIKIKDIYDRQRESIQQSGMQITQHLVQQHLPKTNTRLPDNNILQQVIDYYKNAFDPIHGGISGAPKFPSTFPIRLFLRHYRRTGDMNALDMATFTLEKMANGGMYDHVGGGFHRYATDRQWLIPHFEKMLYDNALLVMAYLDGYQVTGNEDFKRVVMEILQYVRRDMTSPEGAFYSATDADSLAPAGEREEGYFFTWTQKELEDALGKESAAIVRPYYGADGDANFEGRHILYKPFPSAETAKTLGISEDRLKSEIETAKDKLYQWRSRRPPCLRDEKIITAWNGLMISAHARAGLILDEPLYIERAAMAAEFILNHLYIEKRLYRSYKDGQSRHKGYLDDYAFFIAALLDLFEATQAFRWLEKALEMEDMLSRFYEDTSHGGFYMTGHDHEDLITREKPDYDGAEPSGNSIAIMNLLRLNIFTGNARFRHRAENALIQFLGRSETPPIGLTEMLLAFDFYLDHPKEIVIITPPAKENEAKPFLKAFRSQFLPNRMLIFGSSDKISSFPSDMLPIIKTKELLNNKTTGYICEKGACSIPTNDPDAFAMQLNT